MRYPSGYLSYHPTYTAGKVQHLHQPVVKHSLPELRGPKAMATAKPAPCPQIMGQTADSYRHGITPAPANARLLPWQGGDGGLGKNLIQKPRELT